MEANEILMAICELPVAFVDGKKSAVALVRESGLPEAPHVLTRSAVAAILADQPELVDRWLNWSADKRTSSGWYFLEEGDGFIVGHFPDGGRSVFSERVPACAEFIVQEISGMLERHAL